MPSSSEPTTEGQDIKLNQAVSSEGRKSSHGHRRRNTESSAPVSLNISGLGGAQNTIPMPSSSANAAAPSVEALSDKLSLMHLQDNQVIVCITETKGHLKMINEIAKRYNAKAVIHAGDFGFHDKTSWNRLSSRELKACVQYGPLSYNERSKLLRLGDSQLRKACSEGVQLSELELFLNGTEKFDVPVYTIWGNQEDYEVVKKFHHGSYHIPNLYILNPDSSFTISLGNGNSLRLFGIGGTHIYHKFFDIGRGDEMVSGADGLMWTTLMQFGNLIELSERYKDPKETRVFVSHICPGKDGLVNMIAAALDSDITISGALHGRFCSVFTDFSIRSVENFTEHLVHSRTEIPRIWEHVLNILGGAIRESDKKAVEKVLAALNIDAASLEANMKKIWHLNLADVKQGHGLLKVADNQLKIDTISDVGIPINNTHIRRKSSATAGSKEHVSTHEPKDRNVTIDHKLKEQPKSEETESVKNSQPISEAGKVAATAVLEPVMIKETKKVSPKFITKAHVVKTEPQPSSSPKPKDIMPLEQVNDWNVTEPIPLAAPIIPAPASTATFIPLFVSNLPCLLDLEEIQKGLGIHFLKPTTVERLSSNLLKLEFDDQSSFERAHKVLTGAKLSNVPVTLHTTEPTDISKVTPAIVQSHSAPSELAEKTDNAVTQTPSATETYKITLGPVPENVSLDRIKEAYHFKHFKTNKVVMVGQTVEIELDNRKEFDRIKKLIPNIKVSDMALSVISSSAPEEMSTPPSLSSSPLLAPGSPRMLPDGTTSSLAADGW